MIFSGVIFQLRQDTGIQVILAQRPKSSNLVMLEFELVTFQMVAQDLHH